MSSSVSVHNLFVYGGLQESDIVSVLLNRCPETASAVLPGFHRYRLKGRIYPCVLPVEGGKVVGKVLLGLSDDELKILDAFEDVVYDRKNVEVVLTDTSEKKEVETYIWANKDDPNLYGEWDFEEWKQLHKEGFLEATKKFAEDMKNPGANPKLDDLLSSIKHDGGST